MTTEEVLLFLLALASGLSLFVGLAQALDSRPRRALTRRAHAAPPSRRRHAVEARPAELPAPAGRLVAATPAAVAEAEPEPEHVAAVTPTAAESPAVAEAGPEPALPRDPVVPRAPRVTAPPARPWPRRQISLLDPPAAPVEETPAAAAAEVAPLADEPPAVPVGPPAEEESLPVTAKSAAAPALAETAVRVERGDRGDLVAGALGLLRARSHDELLTLLAPVLKAKGRGRARPPASHERALLWAMSALASRARGDEAATRAALEQGIRAMPRGDEAPPPSFSPAGEWIGGQLLAYGEGAGDGSPSTLAELRLCVGVLRGIAMMPPGEAQASASNETASRAGADDLPPWGKALRAHLAVERARDALATAAERRLEGFLDKRDHAGGYRWLKEVLGWDELGERRATVEDAYWKSAGGEVVRLTGEALTAADDLGAATAALEQAEAFVRALPEDAARSPRMDEIRRRLWWGHTKLGVQRLEMGDVSGALEPLYQALRLAGGDADRATETRQTLAQALDAMAVGASDDVEGRLRAGDRAAAESAGQDLCRAIDRGLAEGVSLEELAGALSTRQQVMARIAQADGP